MSEKPIQLLTMALSVECSYCGLPAPLDGPCQHVTCPSCQKSTALKRLVPVMIAAKGEGQVFNSNVRCLRSHRDGPRCATCGRVFEGWRVAQHPLEAAHGPACPGCGSQLSVAPPPDWLREELPSVLAIFGAAQDDGSAAAVGLALEQVQLAPVAMTCPQCAAGLSIQHDDTRSVSCGHCGSAVFIPDEVWRRLHPGKLAREWTIVYRERLLSAEALRERARDAAAQKAREDEQRARAQAQEGERQRKLERTTQAEAKQDTRRILLLAAALVVLAAGCAIFLLARS